MSSTCGRLRIEDEKKRAEDREDGFEEEDNSWDWHIDTSYPMSPAHPEEWYSVWWADIASVYNKLIAPMIPRSNSYLK